MKDEKTNRSEIMKLLIEAGADLDIQNNDGDTVLMIAVRRGNTESVKLLVEWCAKLGIKNNDGLTALKIAESNGYTEIADILRKAGANE